MGRSADSYIFVAVELTNEEAKSYLNRHRECDVNESSWGEDDENFFDIMSECASCHDMKKNKSDIFASVDYEESIISNIFYGFLVLENYLNAYCDSVTVAESISLPEIGVYSRSLEKSFPKKEVKIVNLLSIC